MCQSGDHTCWTIVKVVPTVSVLLFVIIFLACWQYKRHCLSNKPVTGWNMENWQRQNAANQMNNPNAGNNAGFEQQYGIDIAPPAYDANKK